MAIMTSKPRSEVAPDAGLEDTYRRIYNGLGELREVFHRSGRLDDSNAKLDEVAKLIATYIAFRAGDIAFFPDASSNNLLPTLQQAFALAAALPCYRMNTGASMFGSAPLALKPGDEVVARALVIAVKEMVDAALESVSGRVGSLDVVNEAFGHFVRDNFRGNVEDAQYMTPPEVVDFMADMALDLVSESGRKSLTVADPSCGVGSFLTTFASRHAGRGKCSVQLIGQDKVERMVRLATLNLTLCKTSNAKIWSGNSIEPGSPLDGLKGCVDLVLTNPPFGARFPSDLVRQYGADVLPIFAKHARAKGALDSELLFVDRNLQLLKDGGHMLIVLPDSVVSGKGIAALLRQELAKKAEILAVVALPATAFAQAGTRTKTVVLCVRKHRRSRAVATFMGVSADLGFQVASRKGSTVKIAAGQNDLPDLSVAFRVARKIEHAPQSAQVLSRQPSAVIVAESEVVKGSWTPNHYSADRMVAVESISREQNEAPRLADLASCDDRLRSAVCHKKGAVFLSVLHVLGEGMIDCKGALSYSPKTPGRMASPGDILFSRINPRIPRMCVAPDFGMPLMCSAEFIVLQARDGVDPYALTYLLQCDVVQQQIRSVTSGTSASHNRIRAEDLLSIRVPFPPAGTPAALALGRIAAAYRKSVQSVFAASLSLARLRSEESSVTAVVSGS